MGLFILMEASDRLQFPLYNIFFEFQLNKYLLFEAYRLLNVVKSFQTHFFITRVGLVDTGSECHSL